MAGAAAGHCAAGSEAIYRSTELQSFLASFFRMLEKNELHAASFGSVLFSYCKYPAAVFAAGLFPIGMILIPILTLIQGFALSFAVSAFLYAAPEHSVLLVFLLFGLRCLVVLPCYFWLASEGMLMSGRMLRTGGGKENSGAITEYTIFRFVLCLLFLVAGATAEHLFLAQALYAAL